MQLNNVPGSSSTSNKFKMPPKIPAKPTKSSTKSTKSATSAKSAKSAKPTNPTPSKTKSAAMKRPRSISPDSSASGDDSSSAPAPAVDPMEIFRRHFESRFEAIEVAPVVPSTSSNKRKSTAIDEGSDVEGPDYDEDEDSLDSDEEEDWEEEQVLEVVHNDSANLVPSIKESKKGLRAFMVCGYVDMWICASQDVERLWEIRTNFIGV
ncbi:hypothetical protein FPQ18DRAFT_321797 [Pyronema domesticum]|nr:hypothetical protein FPQ18DRAFT_321797 [Pyronema domesticum]